MQMWRRRLVKIQRYSQGNKIYRVVAVRERSGWLYILVIYRRQEQIILDGDFIRLNTFASNSEKRSVVSGHLIAGGPLSISDEYSTIGGDTWLIQNEEMLALNLDGFVGLPLSHDPTVDSSQIWTGSCPAAIGSSDFSTGKL